MNLIILAFWSGELMVGGFRGLWRRGGGCNTLMMMGMDCMSQGQRICKIREVVVKMVQLRFDMVCLESQSRHSNWAQIYPHHNKQIGLAHWE